MTRGLSARRRTRRFTVTAAVSIAAAGCASAGPRPAPPATEAEWRALASPRQAAVDGAARLAIGGIEILGQPAWPTDALSGNGITADLALAELVVAGLIRRADVRFVERRRFAAAVAAEESGVPRAAGAPPAGSSQGAEIFASAVWIQLPTGGAAIEVRLTESARGAVLGTRRTTLPADADLVSTARVTVGAIMGVLGELGRRPAWPDPVANAAPEQFAPSGVSAGAVSSFLAGLAAEESWRWEPARVSYQAAAETAGFFEAEAALARTARLRLGGTLGES
jgi:hypothetical protein